MRFTDFPLYYRIRALNVISSTPTNPVDGPGVSTWVVWSVLVAVLFVGVVVL